MKFSISAYISLVALAQTAFAGQLEDRSYRFYRNKQYKNLSTLSGEEDAASCTGATKTVLGVTTEYITTTAYVTRDATATSAPVYDDEEEEEDEEEDDEELDSESQDAEVGSNSNKIAATTTKAASNAITTAQVVTILTNGQMVATTRTITTTANTVAPTQAAQVANVKNVQVTTTAAAAANNDNNVNNISNVNTQKAAVIAGTTTAAAAATTTTAGNANVIAAVSGTSSAAVSTASAGTSGGDPQTSLTLDPSQIQNNLKSDGQPAGGAVDGQVASLTSVNNFINFCLGKTLTNGAQVRAGSCNVVPMGRILAKDKTPTAKFTTPTNFGKVAANTAFDVKIKIRNFQSGAFTNAAANYYAAPAQVNGEGFVIGHSHVVIEPLPALGSTEPLDPTKFSFFKGLNDPADGNGVLSTSVTAGVPAGAYRLCSINTAANHQPVLASVAQHGSMDDCVYFTSE